MNKIKLRNRLLDIFKKDIHPDLQYVIESLLNDISYMKQDAQFAYINGLITHIRYCARD